MSRKVEFESFFGKGDKLSFFVSSFSSLLPHKQLVDGQELLVLRNL